MTTPRFERPKPGHKWPDGAKALVIVTAEEVDTWHDLTAALLERARWVGGLPSGRTLRAWVHDAGIELSTRDPDQAARTRKATEARLDRLAGHRLEVSDLLASRAVPRSVDLLVRRLAEQEDVERRVADAREKLEEALVMQRAAADGDTEARNSARREVVLARLLYAMERDDRVPIVDLVRIINYGIARHLELEGIAQADEDDDTNPIIVELTLPRPDPAASAALVVPQHQLPERT